MIFGGIVNNYSIGLYNDEMETSYSYQKMNPNTFSNAIIFLFTISLNDKWSTITNITLINLGNNSIRLLRFLFVIFKFYFNYILLNSIIAFIMEVFMNYQIIKDK